MPVRRARWGRKADDFRVGDVFEHPWEVTVDAGTIAVFQSSFLDAMPVFSSRDAARAAGLRDRPVPPLLVWNLGLSFSVHDVSEQAIAHLATMDVRFPEPAYAGDTIRAASKVLGVRATKEGDRAVVHVRTVVRAQKAVVCAFERRALVPAGRVEGRAPDPAPSEKWDFGEVRRVPEGLVPVAPRFGRGTLDPGDVVLPEVGRTVGESEAALLTTLLRNTHPIHTDEPWAKAGGSFTGTRVVYGGLVLAWTAALSSREVASDAAWDFGWADATHPAGVVPGDTLYAAAKVVDAGPDVRTVRLVATKNVAPAAILGRGDDLFAPENDKPAPARIPEKVFEGTRSLLVGCAPTGR